MREVAVQSSVLRNSVTPVCLILKSVGALIMTFPVYQSPTFELPSAASGVASLSAIFSAIRVNDLVSSTVSV